MEGRIAAKLEPDTPATFGDSAGVALKEDEDTGESPWVSTLPAVSPHHIVDEVMSDVSEEPAQGPEDGHPGQDEAAAPGQAASQPSLLPSAHLRSFAGPEASLGAGKPGAQAKLSADASSAATHGSVASLWEKPQSLIYHHHADCCSCLSGHGNVSLLKIPYKRDTGPSCLSHHAARQRGC